MPRGGGIGGGERDGQQRDGQYSPGVADSADRWRSNKPAAVAAEGRPGPGPRAASGQSSPSLPGLAETEQTVSLKVPTAGET